MDLASKQPRSCTIINIVWKSSGESRTYFSNSPRLFRSIDLEGNFCKVMSTSFTKIRFSGTIP